MATTEVPDRAVWVGFCVYGHEHLERTAAQACDGAWDKHWQGSVCGHHDAGLPMSCTCTPTRAEGTHHE